MTRVERSRDFDPHVQLRRTARGWVEPSPTHCSRCGAALGPRAVLVGIQQCSCGRSHRTHHCLACETTHFMPPLGDRCVLLSLDERNMCPARLAERDEPGGR